jgi:phosphoribosylamine--glycine ligase
MRCRDDGHDVKWYVPDNPKSIQVGRGLVERVADWRPWARWADFIFLPDNTKFLSLLDPARREGIPVVGPTPAMAEWELDRTLGMQVFKDHGIAVPPFKTFTDYDSAISCVKKHDEAYVSKPCGDEPDKSLSYVAKTPQDLVYMLERWKAAKRHKGAFILQEKVDGVCEMAVGAWCGPHGFNRGFCENFEFKKLMNGDLGVATGEQGTVIRFVEQSKLADMVLKPLERTLRRNGYVGYIDVNCILDAAGRPWPLEFTMRPGWPTYNIMQSLLEGDHAEWLAALAKGEDTRPFKMNTVATGVVMSIPDYPYSHITRKEVFGIPVYGLTAKLMENVHPCELQLGEAPQMIGGSIQSAPCLVSAGDYLLVASGTGETVSQSARRAYRVLKQVEVPNSPMYRTDIGARLKKQLPLIQSKGFARQLVY